MHKPNLGGFFGDSFCDAGEVDKITPLVIWFISTRTYVVSQNVPFCTRASLISLMSAFFDKNSNLNSEKYYESYVREFLVLFSVFIRQKVTINENVSITDHVFGLQLPDCCKLPINWEYVNEGTSYRNEVMVKFLTLPCFT